MDIRETIFELEERLLNPEVRKSREQLDELIADDFVEFGSSGKIYSKSNILEKLPTDPGATFTIFDFEIKILSPELILATYRSEKTSAQANEVINSLRSSVWKKINGDWKMLFHQGTRLN